jgi:glycosyltransferase involved in cell wall biosynthesis
MLGKSARMKQPCRVDTLLATYNGEQFVECQIESILNQMDSGCRLLIRDDGSSDGTRHLVQRFVSREPRRVVLVDDRGPKLGVCRNFGRLVECSDADYIAFCDQDDVWLPGHISTPLARIQAVEQDVGANMPVLAHTDLVVVDENLQTIAPSFWSYSNIDPYHGSKLNRLLIQNVVTGCATMINRALTRWAFPMPRMGVPMIDWWLALVASAFGRIETIPAKTVLYRQHVNNLVGADRYDWPYIMHRAWEVVCHSWVATCLRRSQWQAEVFLQCYAAKLPAANRKMLSDFVNLSKTGFLERRLLLVKHGLFGTSRLRNLGWLMMI